MPSIKSDALSQSASLFLGTNSEQKSTPPRTEQARTWLFLSVVFSTLLAAAPPIAMICVFFDKYLEKLQSRRECTAWKKLLSTASAKETNSADSSCIIKELLKEYLGDFRPKKEQGLTHAIGCFFKNYSFGHSIKEKQRAALELQTVLEAKKQPAELIKSLTHLKREHPALSHGRLGDLFDVCLQIASDSAAVEGKSDMMPALSSAPTNNHVN